MGHVVSAHAYTQRHEFSVALSRSGLGVAVSRELYWDPRMLPSVSRDEIIRMLFHEGYSYNLIISFLVAVFGICISIRTLKRSLRRQGLKRRGVDSDLRTVGQCLMVC